MVYDEEEDDDEEDDEEEVTCNICDMNCNAAISFTEEDSENQIDICKDCLRQILREAKSSPEIKIVEKIVEKPVEKIIYKTIDRNGKEVGNASGDYRTKFD